MTRTLGMNSDILAYFVITLQTVCAVILYRIITWYSKTLKFERKRGDIMWDALMTIAIDMSQKAITPSEEAFEAIQVASEMNRYYPKLFPRFVKKKVKKDELRNA